MRDIALTVIIFGALPVILMRPQIGIIVWTVIGYLNPHRMTWGFAYNMPFAQIVGIVTIVGTILSKEKKSFPMTGLTITWIVFLLWMLLTSITAMYPGEAWPLFKKVYTIQFFTLLTIVVMQTRERLNYLIWTIVLSLGFYGVKGGIFTILRGGTSRVYGPPGSFIDDNNSLAVALLMALPLAYYLYTTLHNKWLKRAVLAGMPLQFFAVLGSQSRGALVSILAVATVYLYQSKYKFTSLIALVVILPVGYMLMPESWHMRMESIFDYESDSSSMGRLYAWILTINIANDRLFGAGFNPWVSETVFLYGVEGLTGKVAQARAAHSIYFSVLGEHGWIGLFLFIVVGIAVWRTGSRIISISKSHRELEWAGNLASMLKVSLVAYASGGTFLSLSYFDLYWNIVAIMVLCKVIVERKLVAMLNENAPKKASLKNRESMKNPAVKKTNEFNL